MLRTIGLHEVVSSTLTVSKSGIFDPPSFLSPTMDVLKEVLETVGSLDPLSADASPTKVAKFKSFAGPYLRISQELVTRLSGLIDASGLDPDDGDGHWEDHQTLPSTPPVKIPKNMVIQPPHTLLLVSMISSLLRSSASTSWLLCSISCPSRRPSWAASCLKVSHRTNCLRSRNLLRESCAVTRRIQGAGTGFVDRSTLWP